MNTQVPVDRRSFTLGVLLALSGACSTGAASLSQPAKSWWGQYRDRFVAADGRVVDTGNGGISHSEGQGYALLLALHFGDRAAFERIAEWTAATLARSDLALHAWRYDPRAAEPVSDRNNATDGDILIAWALAMAGQRWREPRHFERSAAIRAAIRRGCVIDRDGQSILLPGRDGFVTAGEIVVNPSYLVWPALDAFAKLDGAGVWGPVIASGENLLGLAKFGPDRLPTDWVGITAGGAVAPAAGRPPRFGFDAVRIALYAAMGARNWLAGDIAAYWHKCLAEHRTIPAWVDVGNGETAPYAVSSGGLAIAGRVLGTASPPALASDYYAASLQLLTQA